MPRPLSPAEVRKQIKAGTTGPIYLLEGDDRQARNELAAEFAEVADEGLRAFNVQSFYANEAVTASARDQLIDDVLAAARTLPMMSPRRVLVVHEAERLLSPRKGRDEEAEPEAAPAAGRKRKRSLTPIEALEQYLQAPETETTLVFVAGPLEENRRLVKLVREHAVRVECGTLTSDGEAARWIKDHLAKDGLAIDPKAISLLLGMAGRSVGRLRAELEKLALFAAGEPTLTARHVREIVTPDVQTGGWTAMQDALSRRDARRALREVQSQLDLGMKDFLILGLIRSVVRGLAEDRAARGLDEVFRTDLAIKSSAGDSRFLLERLVIVLCERPGVP